MAERPELSDAYWRRDMAARGVRMRADGVNRADQGLRSFARREGDAVFCRKCDGDGVVICRRLSGPAEPVKCTRCGGEGLEPPE